jgi:predicted phosphodiesterase
VDRDGNILWYDFGNVPSVKIFPLADVHLGAQGCYSEDFYKVLNKIKGEPDSYIMLLGDLIDNGTRNGITNVFKATMPPSQQKKEMAKALEIVRDKLLCFVPGNHERRSGKDADDCPTYDIAAKLDLEDRYRESIAFLRIGLGEHSGKGATKYRHDKKPFVYYIAGVHGTGGGAKPGSSINRADDFMGAFDGVDILIHAHTHKPYTLPGAKIVLDPMNRIAKERPTLDMGVNSWLGWVDYPVYKMMRPTALPKASRLTLSGRDFDFEGVV